MRLIILVGLPGAGKTSWAHQRGRDLRDDPAPARPHETIVVSVDRLRKTLQKRRWNPAQPWDPVREARAFDLFHRQIAELLSGRDERGRPVPQPAAVIADLCCLNPEKRARLREIARDCGAECHAVLFTAVKKALERNAKREHPAPAAVMATMVERFQDTEQQLHAEGYDSVSMVFTGE
jgi:predicted kinase